MQDPAIFYIWHYQMPISILHCWSTGKPYQIFEGYHRLIQPSLHNALNAKSDLDAINNIKFH